MLWGGALVARAEAASLGTEGRLWHDQRPGGALVPAIARAFPSLAPLVKQIKPAVVNISTTQRMRHPGFGYGFQGQDPLNQFFQQFFGGQPPPRDIQRQSLGSGFLINERGNVLTNNHVIDGADEIKVKLADGREFAGKVLGADPKTDVALLELVAAPGGLPYLLLGDSDALEVGDWVVAIGDPFGLELSVTHGMVSAKERSLGAGPYDDFIQSDALINPGNSGGPLFDMEGSVVGINTAISSRGQGIGFAVPINLAKQLLPQLLSGHIVRGWLGVAIQRLTPGLASSLGVPGGSGALVSEVSKNGPAARGGVKRGDVIVALNGRAVASPAELTRAVASVAPGASARLDIVRDGAKTVLSLKVGERPDDVDQLGEAGPEGQPPTAQGKKDVLGLTVGPLGPDEASELGISPDAGVFVAKVEPESPAGQAGLQAGDVVLEVNRRRVRSLGEYRKALAVSHPGEMALLRIQRQREPLFVAVRVPGGR